MPSEPTAIPPGWRSVPSVAIWYSVIWPCMVMRPIRLTPSPPSVNHMAPSGPATMSRGWADSVGVGNSVTAPVVTSRRAMPLAENADSVIQSAPSEPNTIPSGATAVIEIGYVAATVPAVVTLTTTLLSGIETQRWPSPVVMLPGPLPPLASGYSVTWPAGVTLASFLPISTVAHTAPSGPVVMSLGDELRVISGYSVIWPAGVILPILLPRDSTNQSAPSDPVVIAVRPLLAVGTGYSVMPGVAAGVGPLAARTRTS